MLIAAGVQGVHEHVREGNPNDAFNGQRSGFGLASDRPARFGGETWLRPKTSVRGCYATERIV
jgi:hypothetical protein